MPRERDDIKVGNQSLHSTFLTHVYLFFPNGDRCPSSFMEQLEKKAGATAAELNVLLMKQRRMASSIRERCGVQKRVSLRNHDKGESRYLFLRVGCSAASTELKPWKQEER